MKRRYVTTLIVETDDDPAGWNLNQFAREVYEGEAHLSEEPRINDRGPLNMCACEYAQWSNENRGWFGSFTVFKDLTTGALTASVRTACETRFYGAICDACAKVPA